MAILDLQVPSVVTADDPNRAIEVQVSWPNIAALTCGLFEFLL